MYAPKPDANGIIFDDQRADDVLGPLYGDYVGSLGLHRFITREQNAPQMRFIPDGVPQGSLQHTRWLYPAVMTDRRQNSDWVYESHCRLWKLDPRIYGPQVMDVSADDIREYLTYLKQDVIIPPSPEQLPLDFPLDTGETADEAIEVFDDMNLITYLLLGQKIGSPRQSAGYWPRSVSTLFIEFDGDPLRMYRRFGTIDDILEFKRGRGKSNWSDPIPGFGPKILSLQALFLVELGLMEAPPDAFPVDVHVQRLLISTGIITHVGKKKLTNAMVEQTSRRALCRVIARNGWRMENLSHAIWLRGKYLCSKCSKNKAVEALCPVYMLCDGAVISGSYFAKGTWNPDGERQHRGTGNEILIKDL